MFAFIAPEYDRSCDTSPAPQDWAHYGNVCEEVRQWIDRGGFKTMNQVWYWCNHQPDWLLWILGHHLSSWPPKLRQVEIEYCKVEEEANTGWRAFHRPGPHIPYHERIVFCRRIKELFCPKDSPYG